MIFSGIRLVGLIAMGMLWTLNGLGQVSYEPLEWGQVSESDRQMTVYEQERSAPAVVLADEGRQTIWLNEKGAAEAFLRRHRRIKILQDDAIRKYGEVELFYYHREDREQITNLRAQVIFRDGKIEPVVSDEIFISELNENWTRITLSFPNLQVGAIIEYQYDHLSQYILAPDNWVFRDKIPVRSSCFRFLSTLPIYYNFVVKGTDYLSREVLPDGRQRYYEGEMEFVVENTTFWLKNAPSFQLEPNMPGGEDYLLKLRFVARKGQAFSGAKMQFFTSWQDATKALLRQSEIGGAYQKTSQSNRLIKAFENYLGNEKPQTKDLIPTLHEFLVAQFDWDGSTRIYTQLSPDEAFQQHSGGLAEIQYGALAVLHHFGVMAEPILLRTKQRGTVITRYPLVDQFDYVILRAKVQGEWKLLDFVNPGLGPYWVNKAVLQTKGLALSKQGPEWIPIEPRLSCSSFHLAGTINTKAEFTGVLVDTLSGYHAQRLRMKEVGEALAESDFENFTLESTDIRNTTDLDQPLIVDKKLVGVELGFVQDEFLYFSPVQKRLGGNFLPKEHSRTYPFVLDYPIEESSDYVYEIPVEFELESIPENCVFTTRNGLRFEYNIRQEDRRIHLRIVLSVTEEEYSVEAYYTLVKVTENINQKLEEQIVLRRKD